MAYHTSLGRMTHAARCCNKACGAINGLVGLFPVFVCKSSTALRRRLSMGYIFFAVADVDALLRGGCQLSSLEVVDGIMLLCICHL